MIKLSHHICLYLAMRASWVSRCANWTSKRMRMFGLIELEDGFLALIAASAAYPVLWLAVLVPWLNNVTKDTDSYFLQLVTLKVSVLLLNCQQFFFKIAFFSKNRLMFRIAVRHSNLRGKQLANQFADLGDALIGCSNSLRFVANINSTRN